MGLRLAHEVMNHYVGGTPARKLWLVMFAVEAGEDTRTGWPSRERMAQRSEVSVARSSAIASELIQDGALERVRQGGRSGPTIYRIKPLPAPRGCGCKSCRKEYNRRVQEIRSVRNPNTSNGPKSSDSEMKSSDSGVKSSDSEGTNRASSQVALQVVVPGKHIQHITTREEDYFSTFWESYPRRNGKAAAQSAWVKARTADVDPEAIIAAAGRYASQVRAAGTELKYIPYPGRWLSERRWEDYPQEAQIDLATGKEIA